MLAFAIAIFTSAFLLFQVQPLIAKFILPWFGGGTAVWAVSMLFFQTALVAGYAYSHLLVRYLDVRRQVIVHLVVLAVALTQIPVEPAASFEGEVGTDPTFAILLLLAKTIGIPFFVLSTTAPLIQAWVSRTKAISNPYRLYALSNTASLLALLSYPFVVEPLMTRQSQVLTWSIIFGVFAAVCGYCAYRTGFRDEVAEPDGPVHAGGGDTPRFGQWLLWLSLPATAVALLLGVTNQLTRDLVSVPFLWVLPLSVYLLTFIISFDRERWYKRAVFLPAMALSIVAIVYLVIQGQNISVPFAVAVYSVALFVLCMVCHGELNRLRPDPAYLTGFYLMIAVGGALGSAIVAVVMPLVADRYIELQLGVAGAVLLTAILLLRDVSAARGVKYVRFAQVSMVAALVGTSTLLVWSARDDEPDIVLQTRNFYGVLTVGRDHAGSPREALWLRNGTSYHGAQMQLPQLRSRPAAYYAPTSGVAFVLGLTAGMPERRIGMIGLGVGSVASYGRPGDYLRIYEINPEVIRVAESHFTFLADSRAFVEVVPGDARLSLEREPPQTFDVFILDAFSSDAIPVHLLTREAFEVYLRHLEPDGVIAILISSWHFDFEPLLHEMAEELGLYSVLLSQSAGAYEDWGSRWMIMTRNEQYMNHRRVQQAKMNQPSEMRDVRLWTDDFSSPFQLLK